MVTLHEVITFLVSMQISISSLQTHNVNRDRKSGSAGMPRPISYAVFCLKKKTDPQAPLAEADAPARIGRYEIEGTLGAGASAVVYTAYDPKFDRRVALTAFPG